MYLGSCFNLCIVGQAVGFRYAVTLKTQMVFGV